MEDRERVFCDVAVISVGRCSWAGLDYELSVGFGPSSTISRSLAAAFEQANMRVISEIVDDVADTLRSVGKTAQGAVE